MEVRDPIHGSIEVFDSETKIIDHPLFQRLRHIKQMGFSDMAFPGATHTRYLHSIGTMLLAGQAFDSIFKKHIFKRKNLAETFYQLVRLSALLHDIGHAPLSHSTEFAMPIVESLNIPCYKDFPNVQKRRATHEDYTIKIITDSELTTLLTSSFPAFSPLYIAALIEPSLPIRDDFFIDDGINYRTILSQIISSELDVDRMDYLRRDSYFSGVSYGNYDYNWLFSNLTYFVTDTNQAHLAIDPRAIYAFNDFLISRYHMFLMVYFHHKSVIYEELLKRYFLSEDSTYSIPSDIMLYDAVDDYQLYHNLRQEAQNGNHWAKRVVHKQPYRVLYEKHSSPAVDEIQSFIFKLETDNIPYIYTSSKGDISKYTLPGEKRRRGSAIFTRKKQISYFESQDVMLLEDCTDLFAKYQEQRHISRIYVPAEDIPRSQKLLHHFLLKSQSVVDK